MRLTVSIPQLKKYFCLCSLFVVISYYPILLFLDYRGDKALVPFDLSFLSIAQETQRSYLSYLTVISCAISFFFILFGLLLSEANLTKATREISVKSWRILLGIELLALGLVGALVARANRIFFDEHIYQNIGKSIAFTGRALICSYSNNENGSFLPMSFEYNKEPNGFTFYLALFFRLFGANESVAHLANNFVYLIGVGAIFLLVWELIHSERAALYASLCYALTPMVAIWSGTTSAESSTATFSILAVLSALYFVRQYDWPSLLMFVGCFSWAMQFRPESVLIALPVMLLILHRVPFGPRYRKLFCALALVAFITLPMACHLYVVRNEGWGNSGAKFSLEYFYKNIGVNGYFYLLNLEFPIIFSLAAAVGLAFGRRFLWERFSIFIWFLWSWGIFLFFYAGSYKYGADVRFSLISAPPLAVLAGMGLEIIRSAISRRSLPRVANIVVNLCLALSAVSFWPLMRSLGTEGVQSRWDTIKIREFAKLLPPDSIVISHVPSVWHALDKNAAPAPMVKNVQDVTSNLMRRYTGGVYFHHGVWCFFDDPIQGQFCKDIERDYIVETVKEEKVVGTKYGLYRLLPKTEATAKADSPTPTKNNKGNDGKRQCGKI